MTQYRMRGTGLYDRRDHRIAMTRGESIYDAGNRRIGGVHGDDLFDTNGSIMMRIRGRDIFDARNMKVATLAEAEKSIEGTGDPSLVAALWYCFVR